MLCVWVSTKLSLDHFFDVPLGGESEEEEIDDNGLKKEGLPDQKIRQILKEHKRGEFRQKKRRLRKVQ